MLKALYILLIFALITPVAKAGPYVALSPSKMTIKTDSGSTGPVVADFRLGYTYQIHKFEIAFMSSISDDSLNQLVTDVPSATSLFYRYGLTPKNSLSIDFILGYSQIDIESSYVGVPAFTETFEGVSFGIGLEEAFDSIPQLKLKLDYMQLYRGDDLKINALSLGLLYAF